MGAIFILKSLTLAAVIAYSIEISINQTIIRDSAFTPANWLAYSILIVLPL